MSIGLPVRNGMPLLERALASLLRQSFVDFELIISDNASTDGTREVCEALAARDPRVQYFRQATNIGAVRNFDFVRRMARAPYFMWAAHDDKWDRCYIECLKTKLDRDPTCVGAFGSWFGIDATGRVVVQGEPLLLDGDSPLKRLQGFIFRRPDTFFYGLFRTAEIKRLDMRPWRLLPERAEELSHTWLFYLVARGRLLECTETTFFYYLHSRPDIPPLAMFYIKCGQVVRTIPAIWRATKSPTITGAAGLMNLVYQVRNFVWMIFKRALGMPYASRAEVVQVGARGMRK